MLFRKFFLTTVTALILAAGLSAWACYPPLSGSESITMTVKGQSSTGLAAGEKGEGGTSFAGAQVTITQGGNSGAGTLTVPITVTWEKDGPKTYDATDLPPFFGPGIMRVRPLQVQC